MINRIQIKVASVALSLVLLTACSGGLLRGFRVGMNVTLPFVAQLVTEGVISQTIANAVTGDIKDGIDGAVSCDKCLKAIASNVVGKSRQVAKAKCYVALAGDLRAILNRHNIGGVEQLDRIARIISAGISAFEEYARDINAAESSKGRAESMSTENPEKKLKDAIKAFKEQLREATKSTDKGYLFPRDDKFLVAD